MWNKNVTMWNKVLPRTPRDIFAYYVRAGVGREKKRWTVVCSVSIDHDGEVERFRRTACVVCSPAGVIADRRLRGSRQGCLRRAIVSVKQFGTIDSVRSSFDTNSTVLNIPTSQGVFGRRTGKKPLSTQSSRTTGRRRSKVSVGACCFDEKNVKRTTCEPQRVPRSVVSV
jgi:hypothetical protein